MTGFGPAAEWATRTALAGGTVLLLGLAWAALTRCPARRQRIAATAIRGAVLAAGLCLLPGWLTVPVPAASRAAPPRGEPSAVAGSLPAGDPEGTDDPDDEWLTAATVDGGVELRRSPEPEEGEEAPLPAVAAAVPAVLPEVVPVLLGAYFLVAGVMAAQLAVGQMALVRLVWSAAPTPPRVLAALDEVADGPRPRVLASDQVGSPVCFGLLRPVIVLPWELARTASAAELRWVLAHELDHLARGDHRTGWWVGVGRAVFFPVLWFWPLRRTLHLAQEYLADAAAAAAGGRPTEYAEFLVNLSDRPARVPALASGVRAGRSDLFRRVTMLLNPTAGLGRRPSRGWRYLTAGGVLSAAVLLSGLTPATADDPKPKPNPDAIEVEVRVQPDPQVKPDAPRVTRVEVRRVDKAAVADLKAKIKDAIKKGDAEEADRLVEKLEKLLSAPTPPVPPGPPVKPRGQQPPAFPKGPDGMKFEFRFPPDGFDPFAGPGADKMREGMERGMKALKEAMDKADSPEAKEGMKRAMEAMQRAMSQGQRQAEEGQKRAAEAMRDARRQAEDAAREGRRAAEGAMKRAEQERLKALDALREQTEELRKRSEDSKLPEEARRKLEALQRDRAEMQKRLADDLHRKVEEAQRSVEGARKRAAEDMLRKDEAARPRVRLGLQLTHVSDELAEQIDVPAGQGLLVVGVLPDSAAAKAGVKKNDIVVRFNGKPVAGEEKAFIEAVAKATGKAELVVLRKGKKQTITVELAEVKKPAEARKPSEPRTPAVPKPPTPPRFESRKSRTESPDAKDGPKFNQTQVQITDDTFRIRASADDVRYEIRGRIEDGKPTTESIRVTGGEGEPVSAKSLDQVPERHRAAVKKLLASVSGR